MDTELRKTIVDSMDKTVQALRNNFQKIRTGRAHPSLLESIEVEYLGSKLQINQLASINVEDARTLMVSPWDKGSLASVEKAIRNSDLGLNPASQGTSLRVPLPPLNEETRKSYIKQAKHEAEQGRIAIRNIRRDATQKIKQSAGSEDEERRFENELQKITNEHTATIDQLLKQKEADLLEV